MGVINAQVKKGEIMKKVLKKIGSVLVDVLIIIVFIVSTLVVIASVTANRTGGQPSVMGYIFSSVQTDSMQGTINQGDFVVGKLVDDSTEIKLGDIVSYHDYYNGKQIVITHQIVEVMEDDPTNPGYITKGTAVQYEDEIIKYRDDIISIYKFRIPFLGKFIDFLKTPFGFIITLVIPLLAFIAWQAYKLILLIFKSKQAELDEQAEQLKNAQNTKAELSEEEKNAIIAEYLAKQKAQEAEAKQEQESAKEEKSAEQNDDSASSDDKK